MKKLEKQPKKRAVKKQLNWQTKKEEKSSKHYVTGTTIRHGAWSQQ